MADKQAAKLSDPRAIEVIDDKIGDGLERLSIVNENIESMLSRLVGPSPASEKKDGKNLNQGIMTAIDNKLVTMTDVIGKIEKNISKLESLF